jgi:ribosomal protein S16
MTEEMVSRWLHDFKTSLTEETLEDIIKFIDKRWLEYIGLYHDRSKDKKKKLLMASEAHHICAANYMEISHKLKELLRHQRQ